MRNIIECLNIKYKIFYPFILKAMFRLENYNELCSNIEIYCEMNLQLKKLINNHKIIFSDRFLALLYILSNGRTEIIIPENRKTVGLLKNLIIKECYLNKCNFYGINYFITKNFNIYELFDEKDVYIKNEKDIEMIRQNYKQYLLFIEDITFNEFKECISISALVYSKYKRAFKYCEKDISYKVAILNELNTQMYNRSKNNKQAELILLELELFEIRHTIEELLMTSKSELPKLLEKYKKNYNFDYLDIENIEEFYFKESELDLLCETFPNIYFQRDKTYENTENFKEALTKFKNSYYYYKNKNGKSMMDKITIEITTQIQKAFFKHKDNPFLNLENYRMLLPLGYQFFNMYYVEGKYAKETLREIKLDIHDLFVKRSLAIFNIYTHINYSYFILNSFEQDFLDCKTTAKDFKDILSYLRPNLSDTTFSDFFFKKLLSHSFSPNVRKEILKEIIKEKPFQIRNILNVKLNNDVCFEILYLYKNLVSKVNFVKYLKDIETKKALLALRYNEDIIFNLETTDLVNKEILDEIITNSNILLKVIAIYDKNHLDKKNLEPYINNRYIIDKNENLLKYLNEEIIEAYLIKKELTLKDIKDKQILKRVRKVYRNIDNEILEIF